MRFLIDACLVAHARREAMTLLTEDWGFSDIRAYSPADYHGIVIFETRAAANAIESIRT